MRLRKTFLTVAGGILALSLSVFAVQRATAQEKLHWLNFEEALTMADSTNKLIFIDVWAPWCGWCRKMKREVYPKVEKLLSTEFVLTRINHDDHQNSQNYKRRQLSSFELARQFNVQSVPAMVILNSNGDYLLHLSGFMEAEKLKPVLGYLASGAYKTKTFEAFKNK